MIMSIHTRYMRTGPVKVNRLIQGALFYVLFWKKKWQDWENNFLQFKFVYYDITVYPNTACAIFFIDQ